MKDHQDAERPTNKTTLLFRADASTRMGTGHLIRSSSLASILGSSFDCQLVTSCKIQPLIDQVKGAYTAVHLLDGEDEISFLEQCVGGQKFIVLDGYAFDEAYQDRLRQLGFTIAVVDDLVKEPISADLVINHCGGLSPLDYRASPQTVFALGTAYLLLNRLFAVPVDERRTSVTDNNCFLCLGGADPDNNTLKVLEILTRDNAFHHIEVVVGSAYRYLDDLKIYSTGNDKVQIHSGISTIQIKEIMKRCSFAICSPSTVVYEYLSIGGFVWIYQIADNQQFISKFLTENGLAYTFGEDSIPPAGDLSEALQRQAEFFNGRFPEKLAGLFKGLEMSKSFQVRRISGSDLMTCFEWANDPDVRAQSYSSEPVSLEEHTSWFQRKLQQENCFYYIISSHGAPVGQIRFDVSEDKALISYLVDRNFRNQGIGCWLLSAGIRELLKEAKPAQILGDVKKSNISSQRSFEKLAFTRTESLDREDSFTYIMKL